MMGCCLLPLRGFRPPTVPATSAIARSSVRSRVSPRLPAGAPPSRSVGFEVCQAVAGGHFHPADRRSREALACEQNIGEYCSLDAAARPWAATVGEREKLFLDAIAAFRRSPNSPTLTDAELENLREELTWQGSQVPTLSEAEQVLLQSVRSYATPSQAMADDAYDRLKAELKRSGSAIASRGWRCSVRSRRVFADALNPNEGTAGDARSALVFLGSYLGLNVISHMGPVQSLVMSLLVAATSDAFMGALSQAKERRDGLLTRECPNCGTTNQCAFGGAPEGLSGGPERVTVTCPGCGSKLEFSQKSMEVVLKQSTSN